MHAFLGLLLLAVPAGVLYWQDRKLLGVWGWAVGRMVAQVLVLCLLCWVLIRYDRLWLNLAWLCGMSLFTGFMIVNRAKLDRKKFLLPVSVSQFAGCAAIGAYLLYGVLPMRSLEARWLVPVMALLLGHTMSMQIRGLATYNSALKADEQQYEFMRGNGRAHLQAVLPFIRRALQAVLAPSAANLAVMGLFAMPLLLCGLLLAGVEALTACYTTVMLTIGCVAASVVTLLLSIWLSDRRLFDPFGKLTLLAVLLALASCRGQQGNPAQAAAAETDVVGFYDVDKAEKAKTKTTTVMYEQPAPLKDRPELILKRKGYITSYNNKTKNPNWVAWHLTKAHTYGEHQRGGEQFTEDTAAGSGRATDRDYYNSRYDRGHMCPAGDNKWDAQAMTESFLFTNICPQNHGLNKYEWNDLEMQCRSWAREYGAIDIVCGPIYSHKDAQKTIGRNRVWVPDAFFKVILCRKGKAKAIGFIYRNEGVKQTVEEAVRSVDEIEALTGIDFFPALDDAIENKIEAEARLSDW